MCVVVGGKEEKSKHACVICNLEWKPCTDILFQVTNICPIWEHRN